MCELLAISARLPTSVSLSFQALSRHGDCDRPHHDGWGVAFVRDRDALLVKEPRPAGRSPMARFIASAEIESTIVISHIRKATRGRKTFENTHPFSRELGGRAHVFAHNGNLHDVKGMALGRIRPIGDTDSEHAFCALLARLEPSWGRDQAPGLRERAAIVEEFAAEVRGLGPANFLYTDTDALFVHAHRLPKTDDDEPDRPGLHVLARTCAVDLDSVRGRPLSNEPQLVHIVATVPLSDETWAPMGIGELAVVRQGRLVDASS